MLSKYTHMCCASSFVSKLWILPSSSWLLTFSLMFKGIFMSIDSSLPYLFMVCALMHSHRKLLYIFCALVVVIFLLQDAQQCLDLDDILASRLVLLFQGCSDTASHDGPFSPASNVPLSSSDERNDATVFSLPDLSKRDVCTDALPGTVSNQCGQSTLCCEY